MRFVPIGTDAFIIVVKAVLIKQPASKEQFKVTYLELV